MQFLFQICWVLRLLLGLLRVFLRLWLSGAGLAVFLNMLWHLPFGLSLVGLGTLALDLLGKSWYNLWRSFWHI